MIWLFSWFRTLREEQGKVAAEIWKTRQDISALHEIVHQTLARKDLFQHQEFLKLHRRGLMKNISDGEGGNTWVIDEEKLDALLKK